MEIKDYCALCGKEIVGGVWTNGDGYGDGKYVDLDAGPLKGYCWDCARKNKTPDLNDEIDRRFEERGLCGFLEAWVGRCRNPRPCERHKDIKCWKCGEPAINNCESTVLGGSLVCGFPSCKEHPHSETHFIKGS